jgi:hypothetical protein
MNGTIARVGVMLLGLIVLALMASTFMARFPSTEGARVVPSGAGVIRVQVLNGSRAGGIGAKVASALREGGFHVVEIGNADRADYFATLVVARTPDPGPARAVARYLGGLPVVLEARDTDEAEVTVVLGSDRSHLRMEE